ncbi:MAG: hypothetical protein M1837_003912 [Sclerophora amabilis]|nr:MAG: hypothetical protein M1837_003912 [Sclerophora amabilis]
MSTLGSTNVRYSFTSVYRFSSEAVDAVIKIFEQSTKGHHAVITYHKDNESFLIDADRREGDECFASFFESITKYIEKETASDSADSNGSKVTLDTGYEGYRILISLIALQEPKVERIPETCTYRAPVVWQSLDEDDVPPTGTESHLSGDTGRYRIHDTWKSTDERKDFGLMAQAFDDDLIRELSETTGCMLRLNPAQRNVALAGDNEEQILRLKGKLDNLELDFQNRLESVSAHHLITEAKKGAWLRFFKLPSLPHKMLFTTLIDPGSPVINELPTLRVLRMLELDERSNQLVPYVTPDPQLAPEPSEIEGSRVWRDYYFREAGDETLNSINWVNEVPFQSLAADGNSLQELSHEDKVGEVEKWTQGVEGPLFEDEADVEPSVQSAAIVPTSSDLVLPKNKYGKKRKPKVNKATLPSATTNKGTPSANEALHEAKLASLTTDKSEPDDNEPAPMELMSLETAEPITRPERALVCSVAPRSPEIYDPLDAERSYDLTSDALDQFEANQLEEIPKPPVEKSMGTGLVSDIDQNPLIELSEVSQSQQLPWPNTHRTASDSKLFSSVFEMPITSQEDMLLDLTEGNEDCSTENPFSLIDLPSLSDPALVPTSPSTRETLRGLGTEMQPTLRNHARSAESSRSRDRDSSSPLDEKLQQNDEVATRFHRQTMNQQSASMVSSNFLMEDLPEGMHEEFLEMLALARSHRGELKLQIELGRILMKGIPRKFHKPFPEEHWLDAVQTGDQGNPVMTFTNMLTSSVLDTEYIWDLRDDQDNRLFNSSVDAFQVIYEFVCLNRDDEEVVVEINAETFDYEVKRLTRSFGTAYLHYPKRNWDAQLSLIGTGFGSHTYEGAKSLVDNLFIEPNLSLLTLSTRSSIKHLRVQSVFLRRQSRHLSAQTSQGAGALTLCITEVQDLILQELPNVKGALRASARPPRDMIEDSSGGTRLWYEVSLMSVSAEERLKENQNLEVGERAQWTAEDILGGREGLEDLCRLTHAIVTRIDGVGYHNVGPVKPVIAAAAASPAMMRKTPSHASSEKPGKEPEAEGQKDAGMDDEEFW